MAFFAENSKCTCSGLLEKSVSSHCQFHLFIDQSKMQCYNYNCSTSNSQDLPILIRAVHSGHAAQTYFPKEEIITIECWVFAEASSTLTPVVIAFLKTKLHFSTFKPESRKELAVQNLLDNLGKIIKDHISI